MNNICALLSAALGKLHTGVLIVDEQLRISFINPWLHTTATAQPCAVADGNVLTRIAAPA
jgi:hypothetical protein